MTTTSIVDHPAADPALIESGRGRTLNPTPTVSGCVSSGTWRKW